MNLKKMKIRSKFNLLMIGVIVFLTVVISTLASNRIDSAMTNVYRDRVAVESELGLKLLDEAFPGDWNVRNGDLYKGNRKINEKNEIFDEIGDITGGLANVFLGNYTVATNIVVNGERRIGADADSAIATAVLEKGETYVGKADISGKLYATIYQPIKNNSGEIIGMWLVGTSIDNINDTVTSTLLVVIMAIIITGLVAITITVLFTRSIVRPIKVVNDQLREIAEGEGDLTKEILIKSQDEIGDMASSFNKMMETLRSMLGHVSDTSEQVAASAEELMASAEQTSSATNQVALAIQEVSNAIEVQGKNTEESAETIAEITMGIQHITSSINTVAEAANDTMSQATKGKDYIQKVITQVSNIYNTSSETIEVMNQLEHRSREIEKIIDVITDIAGQTNLLALNAAIEAARAGEHGKGFAVVADEIGKLAEQSRNSANQIVEIIKLIQNDMLTAVKITNDGNKVAVSGLELAEETGNSFGQILTAIQDVSAQTQELSSISEEISASIEQVNTTIEEIAQLAKANSDHTTDIASSSEEQLATMEEVNSSVTVLASMAEQLKILVNRFKI